MLLFLKMTVYTFQSKCQTYFFPHGLTLILLRVYMATFPYLLQFFSFPFSINLTSFCFLLCFSIHSSIFFSLAFLTLFSFREFFYTGYHLYSFLLCVNLSTSNSYRFICCNVRIDMVFFFFFSSFSFSRSLVVLPCSQAVFSSSSLC